MATFVTIPQLLTTDQLRERIGNPTKDPNDPGGIADSVLQDIIDEEEDNLASLFETRAIQNDFENVPDNLYEKQTVSLSQDSDNSNLASGSLPSTYYPIAKDAVDGDGDHLQYDPKINTTAQVTSFYTPKRYMIDDTNIYAIPNSITSVVVWLPKKSDLFDKIMGDEIFQANQRIVQKGQNLLNSKVREGVRQATGIDIENDQ